MYFNNYKYFMDSLNYVENLFRTLNLHICSNIFIEIIFSTCLFAQHILLENMIFLYFCFLNSISQ